MKSSKLLAVALMGLLATGASFAQNKSDVSNDDINTIDVGVGGMFNGDQGMEAILKVSTNVTSEADDQNNYWIAVRLNADGSITSGNFNYIDISMHALGLGLTSDGPVYNGFIEATALNINYKRNLAIDLDHQLTISLVGIRGGGSIAVSDNLKVMAETALDFAAVGLSSKRASDAAAMSHSGERESLNARISVAVELYKKVRIELGMKASTIGSKGVVYNTGTVTCNTYTDGYYDSWGYYHSQSYTRCYNDTAVDYRQTWKSKEIYLSFVAKITDNLKAFGKVAYNVYSINDRTAEVTGSSNNAWTFMFGMTYTIPYKKAE